MTVSPEKMNRPIQCPHCTKRFADNNGAYSHIKKKHGGKGKAAFRHQCDDESFADRAIQAEIDRACGIPNDDDWLLP